MSESTFSGVRFYQLIPVACRGDVWVGLGVAVVRRDGFDVVAGIAIQIFVVAFVFANDASISRDFSRDYLVGALRRRCEAGVPCCSLRREQR